MSTNACYYAHCSTFKRVPSDEHTVLVASDVERCDPFHTRKDNVHNKVHSRWIANDIR